MRSPFDSLLLKRVVGSGKLVRRHAERSRVEEVIVRRVRALVPERLNLTWHEPVLLLGPTVKSAYSGSSARGEVNPSGVGFVVRLNQEIAFFQKGWRMKRKRSFRSND